MSLDLIVHVDRGAEVDKLYNESIHLSFEHKIVRFYIIMNYTHFVDFMDGFEHLLNYLKLFDDIL